MHGGTADRVVIHATAPTATMDWNIHGHAGGGTQTVAEGLALTTLDYEFKPSETADWFLILRNSGTGPLTINVRLEFYGGATWDDWQ